MAFDIKKTIDELVGKIKGDPNLASKFVKEPIQTVENLIGLDLPDDQIEQLVKGIKAKMDMDKLGDIAGRLGGLLGKK